MTIQNKRLEGKDGSIVGITLFSRPKKELLSQVQKKVSHQEGFIVHTIFSEILFEGIKNKQYKKILQRGDANVIDGVAVEIARRFEILELHSKSNIEKSYAWVKTTIDVVNDLRNNTFKPIKGRVLFFDLLKLASKNNLPVVFIGNNQGSAEKASLIIQKKYPNLSIHTFVGPFVTKEGQPINKKEAELEKIIIEYLKNEKRYTFVFVGMGAPKQEYFISRLNNRESIQNASHDLRQSELSKEYRDESFESNVIKKNALWIGVGGTFDYVSGVMKTPPPFFEKNGLEWFWRLSQEPKRVFRIINAVIKLPLTLINQKVS